MYTKCDQLEQRIEALEKIINPNSVTLVNKQDLNERVVLEYDGEFRSKKLTTTVSEVELGTSEGL
jgi:hypothetical protein